MAQSTLQTDFYKLQAEVGFYLGYGRGAKYSELAWDANQQNAIDRCVQGGLRQFYFSGIDWSFLKPVATLTLKKGSNVLPLPDDYAGKEGPLNLALATSINWSQLQFCDIGSVYHEQALHPSTTGRPKLVCEEPTKGTGQFQGQRLQFRFWPIADQDYSIQFAYYLNPDYLTGTYPYAYGGAQHAETLLEACLERAELILNGQAGAHAAAFAKALAVSKDMDRRNKPVNLGRNLDRSDWQGRMGPWGRRSWSPILYKGNILP